MIVKRLYLNMENWSVSRGSYQLGYIAENQVTLLQIATEIDPNCTYHLEQKINDESYILYLEKGDGVLTATIPNTMLTNKGNANWQIVGIWADESVKKSNIFSVYISDSINAENEVPASEITAFTEALADLAGNMSEVAAYAESASASASNASTSASNASESAESASAAAESASASAESASTSAESASTYATNASASASEASTHATNASESATNASESATNASESASEANTSARNARTSASEASASATTATEQASLASSAATSAQTYAGNASTSEQNCATYASNARVSAEKAQEYVESLDNWTTVEFTLADFTYDENSGWSTFRIELPGGYILAEARGYYVLNNVKLNSNSTFMGIEPTTRSHDNSSAGLVNQMMNTDIMADSGTFEASYNHNLNIYTIQYIHSTRTSNVEWNSSPLSGTGIYRSKSMMSSNWFTNNSLTIKTNIPYPNILNFYGKLQYRVVPAS